MPKKAKELSASDVAELRTDGRYSAGGADGLHLRIAGNSRSWVLRIAVGTRKNSKGEIVVHRRDMGLGSYPEVSLDEAREKARELRVKVRNGIDPLDQKKQNKEILCIKEAILSLAKKEDLTYETAETVMDEIMTGQASPVQMSAYLTALSLKGETTDEITASAYSMRRHCVRLLHDVDALEIVGTGGDGANTFNISTSAAIITAAAGIPVAKHGNRSASSKCGAADVLEALGVNIGITPEKSAELLKSIGICFLYAQNYHIAMKYVAPVRRELAIRTVFNILGPLTNPAGARMELMGVYDSELLEPLARVMCNLGVKSAMLVHGEDGLDEISLSAPTLVYEVKNGWIRSYTIAPEQFGFERCAKSDLVGGIPSENAEILKAVLGGKKGPKRNAAVLNAAAALYISGKYDSIEASVKVAENVIDSGKALLKLDEFIRRSNEA
jgi:anthranilate phosphoribosyltransferase